MSPTPHSPSPSTSQADAATAAALREHWGRLLALLASQYRRLDLAEDGLADAFEAAARTWSRDGVPANPPAWLLTAARRRVLDRIRAEAVAARRMPELAVAVELTEQAQQTLALGADATGEVADERLRLVLLCAHPSLPPPAAAALTLRLVMGVSTDDLARLFLVRPSAMAARLTRARKALADRSFSVPVGVDLDRRVAVVGDIAYLAFTAGYAPGSGPDVLRADVAAEAIRLVRVLRSVLPTAPSELDALLALMLLQHSRRDARAPDGRLVLLPHQDRSRWHADEIAEAIALLTPLVHAPPAPYLLQALIASEHAVARRAGDTAWSRIVARYDELLTLADTPVVRLNRAVAVAEADGPLAGLAALEPLDEAALPGHRLPAARAELLARAGRIAQARAAYTEALARCANEAELAFLDARRRELG